MPDPLLLSRPAALTPRAELRAATASLHSRLDAAVARACLEPPSVHRLLTLHASAVPALHEALARADAQALLHEWGEVARLDLLRADCARLGLPPPAVLTVPRVPPGAACWGVLYALLGSRLGGVVLHERFVAAGEPRSHFLAAGDGAGWRRFTERLGTELTPATMAEAVHGATLAMRTYLDALTPLLAGGDRADATPATRPRR